MTRWIVFAIVVGLCLISSVSLNILPRVLNPTFVNVLMAVVQSSFIILAMVIPTGMEWNGAGRVKRAVGWCVWAVLILASFTFGMEGSSHFRADATREARVEIQDATLAQGRLGELRAELGGLGAFTPTNEAGVEIAKQAWEAAKTGKATECTTGVGLKCQGWDVTIQERLGAWGRASAEHEKTEKAAGLRSEIKSLEEGLRGRVAPAVADPMASGWAHLLSLLGLTVGESSIAPWITIGLSLILEIIGGVVPWLILPKHSPTSLQSSPTSLQTPEPATVLPLETLEKVSNRKSSAKRRPTQESLETARTTISSVGEWYLTQVDVAADARLPAGEAQKLYRGWCYAQGATPASPPQFKAAMLNELKVPYVTERGRGFYTISIKKAGPRLVKKQ